MRAAVRSVVASLAWLGSGATVLWAADPPYAGTWKLNPAKSDFGETTVTYENMAGGQMKFTTDGLSYTFKADGKDYPTPWGNSAAWKAIDANTWEVTNKTNGKVTGTGTLKLSVDGKSFTVDSRNIKATGETSNDSAVFQRVSGGAGLAGTWKNKNVKIGSPGTVRMSPSGSDGLTLTFVEEKGTCNARFDGKDHPATGPIWPSGWTCAIAKNGATALDVTWKKDGKPMYKDTFTASADGKTLTDVSGAAATTEKVKLLYDRQ
jgi:hypothetical protein